MDRFSDPAASSDAASTLPHDDALAAAVEAAEAAATVIRRHSTRSSTAELAADAKGRNDFVTAVDEAAQSAIIGHLEERFPDDTILAEEGADTEELSAVVDGRRWIVDPLDGTTNFMHRVPPVAVSIALQEGETLALGVVLDVTHDELFLALQGHGAYRRRLTGTGPAASEARAPDEDAADTRLRVTATEALGDSLLATGFPYRNFAHTDAYLDVLGQFLRQARGVRRHGSAAIDLVRTADACFSGFFETGLRPWDVAAGTLIVREAGGRVTDYQGRGGLHPVFGRQVLASNGRIHDAMHAVLAEMDDTRL
jgi:myo-inositol-1(or 4)-monophosphatase